MRCDDTFEECVHDETLQECAHCQVTLLDM